MPIGAEFAGCGTRRVELLLIRPAAACSPPLACKFLNGAYKSELNLTSEHGGKLAEAFGAVMDEMWQVSCSLVAPGRAAQYLTVPCSGPLYTSHQACRAGAHARTPRS